MQGLTKKSGSISRSFRTSARPVSGTASAVGTDLVIIRAVNSVDATSATIEEIPYPLLHRITDRILAEVKGVNRVLYDLSPKPCATIEWE